MASKKKEPTGLVMVVKKRGSRLKRKEVVESAARERRQKEVWKIKERDRERRERPRKTTER